MQTGTFDVYLLNNTNGDGILTDAATGGVETLNRAVTAVSIVNGSDAQSINLLNSTVDTPADASDQDTCISSDL